ncbi:leucyl aminopeptidase [Halobacillus locisalis]|uniref:Probable cytosol aminopeptidase n=1 Tax=Halobacillus locisalis TaxID=220753 RepID=A0A838CUW6_9BACI|nr:leucyl aminopeptidase [Halobacillus locisalis]MBA2175770.1 leucyl aminopeptidase [Halobacillus locisalis]
MFTIQSINQSVTKTVLVGLFEDEKEVRLSFEVGEELHTYVNRGDVSAKFKAVTPILLANEQSLEQIYVVGLGKKEHITSDRFRKVLGHAFQRVQKDGIQELTVDLDGFIGHLDFETSVPQLAESFVVSTYALPTLKSKEAKSNKIEKLHVRTERESGDVLSLLEKGDAFARGVNAARNLVHLPANIVTATKLAEHAKQLAAKYGMDVQILDKKEMEDLGMGALLAVNQGSTEPPKMIVLKYQGLEEWSDVTAFVGKGITYDTGGYSIKPKTGMPGMKGDMGGAAAVLGAMETIGMQKPKKNVIAVIPSSDNMISGDAFKPDDVITSMSGQTIEVLNTDAEGRLALADGVTYAKEEGAERIINVATLTGGVVTALGSWMTGAMTNDAPLYSDLEERASLMGEPIWQLPYNEDYKAQVRKSDIADLNNSPTRKAHAIMGGAFVGAFVGKTPWVHLDIAGTSVAEGPHELGPKGPTGVMSKTLASYIIR